MSVSDSDSDVVRQAKPANANNVITPKGHSVSVGSPEWLTSKTD